MMEQAGSAAGEQAKRSRSKCAVCICLRGACAFRLRQPGAREASGPDLGVLRPLCEELADGPGDIGTRKRGPKL